LGGFWYLANDEWRMFWKVFNEQIWFIWYVLGSGYKYIYCDLIDCDGYMTMTLTVGPYFVISFSLHLNIRGFVHFSNFGVTFCNKFEKGDWGLVIKVGVSTIIEHIYPFFYYYILFLHTPYKNSFKGKT
jgi:hypothetical protein